MTRPTKSCPFETEADMVRAFVELVEKRNASARDNDRWQHDWAVYPETGGFDLLLVCRKTEIQIGIEAKLALNIKVIEQAMEGGSSRYFVSGPDYRAVLVPDGPSVQRGIGTIANRIGLTVIKIYDCGYSYRGTHDPDWHSSTSLPDENSEFSLSGWYPWCPVERIKLPDYIPDVEGGHKSPVALTDWKVRAIKLMILLERRGAVHRSDMKVLGLSPARFTDAYNGFLAATPGGYIRCDRTPDFRAQHPRNYAEIEADFDKWNPYAGLEMA